MNQAKFDVSDYERFFSLSLELFCVAGTDGYFKQLNPSWERLLGYTTEELQSRPFIEFVHPQDRLRTVAANSLCVDGLDLTQFENRYRCRDGSYRWIHWTSSTLLGRGLIYAVARDVTELKESQQMLEQAQIRLEETYEQERKSRAEVELESRNRMLLLEQIPAVAAILRGEDLVYEFANEPYRQMLGGRNPVGRRLQDVLPDLESSIFEAGRRSLRTGERFTGRDRCLKADWHGNGKPFEKYFTFSFEPIRNAENEFDGIWVLALDVTETKKMESRLRSTERLASLGTLAAGVAHEINNPLGYALTNLSNVLENAPDLEQKTRELLLDTADGLRRTSEIIRSLKTFSRQDTAPELEVVEIHEVVTQAARFTKNELRHRARLVFDFGPTPRVYAQKSQLIQVFVNLLINAAQAIPIGHATQNEIRITTCTGINGDAIVRVRDTGVGIPSDKVDHVFEPYFTTKGIGEGTGLGLSICHGIVSSFGGEISVESQLELGTTFEVRFPGCDALRATEPALPLELPVQEKRVARLRILAIDDERRLLDAVSAVLLRDHQLTLCTTGRDGLELLRQGQAFDLILCDLMMPEVTGMELYAEISSWNQGLERKIIFMTGGAFTQDGIEFLKRVPNLKLEKPFTAQVLRQAIQAWKETGSA